MKRVASKQRTSTRKSAPRRWGNTERIEGKSGSCHSKQSQWRSKRHSRRWNRITDFHMDGSTSEVPLNRFDRPKRVLTGRVKEFLDAFGRDVSTDGPLRSRSKLNGRNSVSNDRTKGEWDSPRTVRSLSILGERCCFCHLLPRPPHPPHPPGYTVIH